MCRAQTGAFGVGYLGRAPSLCRASDEDAEASRPVSSSSLLPAIILRASASSWRVVRSVRRSCRSILARRPPKSWGSRNGSPQPHCFSPPRWPPTTRGWATGPPSSSADCDSCDTPMQHRAATRAAAILKLTSGSTGLPKAALANDAQMIGDGTQIAGAMGIRRPTPRLRSSRCRTPTGSACS